MEESFSGIFQEFSKAAHKSPSEKAVLFKKEQQYNSLTYGGLYKQVLLLGNYLRARGIDASDKVGVLIENQPGWPICFFAIQYLGATVVPLDCNLPHEKIIELLGHAGCKKLLCSEKIFNTFREYIDNFKNVDIQVVDEPKFLEESKSSTWVLVDEHKDVSADDIAAMFYTSGTTETPKAVMLSQRNLLSNVEAIRKAGAIGQRDVFISLLPLYHTYAFMATCLFPLLQGAQISYPPRITPNDILECMRKTNVSVLVGVPQLFLLFHREIERKLEKLPFFIAFFIMFSLDALWIIRQRFGLNLSKRLLAKLHWVFGSSLRYMISGGARLEPQTMRDFCKWGFTILEGYGLTETSPIVTMNPPARYKIGSVGRVIPGVQVKILDPDENGIGEVAIKGPNVMAGYYRMPEETQDVIKEDWFLSGDQGYLDKEGFLYIIGRKDEMIVLSSGENINPEEIEHHYGASPYIKEICVFSAKGEGYFEHASQLMAVVVPDQEYFRKDKRVNIDEKIKWELDRFSYQLSNHKRIKGFAISKYRLPRTPMGKLMRYKIKEEYPKHKLDVSERKKMPLSEEDLKLLSSQLCRKALAYLSNHFKKEVRLDDHLELDLGVDSLGRIELLLELQEVLKIRVPEAELENFFYSNTIKELFLKVKPYLSEDIEVTSKETAYSWSEILAKDPSKNVKGMMRIRPTSFDRIMTLGFVIGLKIMFWLLFRIEVRGKDMLPAKGPFIIYANHTSYLDGFLVGAALPVRVLNNTFFLGFREFFTNIVTGKLVKVGRLLPIDIALSMVDTMQACAYLINHKKNICYFPEGQRSPHERIIEFKKGIGILVKELKAPSVPVYIDGAFKAWGRRTTVLTPSKITVTFGKITTYPEVVSLLMDREDTYENISEVLREQLINLKKASQR